MYTHTRTHARTHACTHTHKHYLIVELKGSSGGQVLRRGGSGGGVGVGGVSASMNSRRAHTSNPVLTSFCRRRDRGGCGRGVLKGQREGERVQHVGREGQGEGQGV